MPGTIDPPCAASASAEENAWIERSAGGVADLEVEVWPGRDAVASGDPAARSDGLTAPDSDTRPETPACRGEVGVEGPNAGPSRCRLVLDLDDETVAGPAAGRADDAGGRGPDGAAEGDREVGAVVVPGPSRDRVPPPAERGADRAAGGAGHERRGEALGPWRRWLACGLSGGCGAPFVGRVLGRVATRSQPGEHGRRALGRRAADDLLGARERHRQCGAEDGGMGGEPEASRGETGERKHGAS